MLNNEFPIALDRLVGLATSLRMQNARLVTASALDLGDHLEVIYHFIRNHEITNYRLTLEPGQDEIPSLSAVYPGAFLIENEMKDMFGLKFPGLTVDYGGHMYVTEGFGNPLRKQQVAAAGDQAAPATEV
jgi:ech hydrogenase subunit D